MEAQLSDSDRTAVDAALDAWRADTVRRLWQGDASLWTGADEARWLGWLDAPRSQRETLPALNALGAAARGDGIRHVRLLGMGGSSLCAEVLAAVLRPSGPELRVVDSTVPAEVRAATGGLRPDDTLFLVSSKSGTTTETDVLRRHFWEWSQRKADRFVAITDPGSALEAIARDQEWRAVVHGVPEIGGRFSALSAFGLVPAALQGIDTDDLLARAARMADACGADAEANPGVALGATLAALAQRGRDKLTLVTSPGVSSFGAWLDQLVAESTGHDGRGIVPIDGERLANPERYGDDRVFVHVRLASDASQDAESALARLAGAGHPVLRIVVDDPREIGAELYRWEMATAVAGAVLGVNPFVQPDVEAAKQAARRQVAAYEEHGALPRSEPIARDGALEAHADPDNAKALGAGDLGALWHAHRARLRPGDYFAINAFVERNDANARALDTLRHTVRDAHGVATSVGFGPRFLHSTGQLHKGGPDTGVFLQLTAADAEDLPIPERDIRFGVLKDAQAAGDLAVLCERGRRVLRIHTSDGDVAAAAARLAELVR